MQITVYFTYTLNCHLKSSCYREHHQWGNDHFAVYNFKKLLGRSPAVRFLFVSCMFQFRFTTVHTQVLSEIRLNCISSIFQSRHSYSNHNHHHPRRRCRCYHHYHHLTFLKPFIWCQWVRMTNLNSLTHLSISISCYFFLCIVLSLFILSIQPSRELLSFNFPAQFVCSAFLVLVRPNG